MVRMEMLKQMDLTGPNARANLVNSANKYLNGYAVLFLMELL